MDSTMFTDTCQWSILVKETPLKRHWPALQPLTYRLNKRVLVLTGRALSLS